MMRPSPRSRPWRGCVLVLVSILVTAIPYLVARADETLLDRAGAVAELRGNRSRAVAFFERNGAHLDVTILLGGRAAGAELLRARVRLGDGQRHVLRLSAGAVGMPAEVYVMERLGPAVRLGVSPGPSDPAVSSSGLASLR